MLHNGNGVTRKRRSGRAILWASVKNSELGIASRVWPFFLLLFP